MTIKECVDSWINGNRSTVVDYIIGLPTNAQSAYYATAISKELYGQDDWHDFLNMIANRILPTV